METIPLGKSELFVPRIAIGTWQASGWATSDEDQMIRIIRSGIENGLNFIDTAESYGDGLSEEIVRKAVDKQRHQVIIATKFSHKNASSQKVRAALEQSLRRLKTDYIDLYQYHWPSPTVPLKETIGTLMDFKKEGKIRAIGVSNWMEPEWEEVADLSSIDSSQNCYSLLWRNIEKNVASLCKENNITVLAYSPLAQGILTGKFKEPNNLPPDSRRQNILFNPDNFSAVQKILLEIDSMAKQYGVTMSQVALAWLLQNPLKPIVIMGNSKLDQFKENIKASKLKLSESDVNRLSEISSAFSLKRDPHQSLWNWHPKKRHV